MVYRILFFELELRYKETSNKRLKYVYFWFAVNVSLQPKINFFETFIVGLQETFPQYQK